VEIKYRIEGMDCANCALTLERGVARLPGVEQVQVNFTTETLEATGNFDPQSIAQRVSALGYRVVEADESSQPPSVSRRAPDGVFGFIRYLLSSRQTVLALGACLMLVLSAVLILGLEGAWSDTAALALQLGVVLLAGAPIMRRGIKALLVSRRITIDLLMSIATLGALLIGETGEAATVIVLFALGEALEGYSAERARDSLRSLLALKPDQAHILRPCMDCAEHLGQEGYAGGPCPFCEPHAVTLPVGEVKVGEIVLVRPGERIPVDGEISKGQSEINQAPVTGESSPVTKGPGARVYSGTMNGEAALEIVVTRPAEDSTISRIVRLVEQAQSQRAPVERFIDRFASWYTPAVVALAALMAIVPPLIFGAPFFDLADGTHGWLYRALALLIIACPCALVISTPVTTVSALARLARDGILVKGGVFLDLLARARAYAFDKTGTLTRGKPAVVQAVTLSCQPDKERCSSCDEMVLLAAGVESRSAHPLAQAILAEAHQRNFWHEFPEVDAVQSIAGQGVRGMSDGALITVGSHALFHQSENGVNGATCQALHDQVLSAEAIGQTVMLVSRDEQVLGFIGVSDVPRPTSQGALAALRALDPRLHTIMLTGDNPVVARQIADSIGGIDEVRAELLPEDKLSVVRDLLGVYGTVVMVGDGVNDAPALTAASVGVAMGGAGSAQAMETADVVLMQDNLTHLPQAVRTSRKAHNIIWQNIALSLAIKGVFLLLALPGWTTLWMAVFADMGASLLVTLNGMRMLRE